MFLALRILAALLALAATAAAQTSPGFIVGQTLGATQLNAAFAGKVDYPISSGLQINGPGLAAQAFTTLDINSGNDCGAGHCTASIVAGNNLTGTFGGEIFWNNWAIINDDVALPAGTPLTLLVVTDFLNGFSAQGYRTAIQGHIKQSTPTTNLSANGNYVGVSGIAETSSGDGGTGSTYQGSYYGGNTWCGNGVAGGNLLICTGLEVDNYGVTGATENYKFGINIADGNPSGDGLWDAAVAVYTIGPAAPYGQGRGWQCGFCIGEVTESGLQPLAASGTIIGTHLEALGTINVDKGIDWERVACTTSYLNFGGALIVDCAGNIRGQGYSQNGAMEILAATAPPAGGSLGNGYRMGTTANFGIFFGSGVPTLSAAQGSLYLRTDGAINARLYINTNGTTGWTAFSTAS